MAIKNYKGRMVLSVVAKCSDMFSATLRDINGKTLKEHDGYVPEFMPGEHYGDYVEIDIDMVSGEILNWKKPSQAAIKKFIEKGE